MKALGEAAGLFLVGSVVALCIAVFILIRSAQVAWNLLGETDGQHGN